jgi:hypothetical protein
MIVKNKKTDEDRAFWAHCEAVAKEVALWPKWMRGEVTRPETWPAVKCTERNPVETRNSETTATR